MPKSLRDYIKALITNISNPGRHLDDREKILAQLEKLVNTNLKKNEQKFNESLESFDTQWNEFERITDLFNKAHPSASSAKVDALIVNIAQEVRFNRFKKPNSPFPESSNGENALSNKRLNALRGTPDVPSQEELNLDKTIKELNANGMLEAAEILNIERDRLRLERLYPKQSSNTPSTSNPKILITNIENELESALGNNPGSDPIDYRALFNNISDTMEGNLADAQAAVLDTKQSIRDLAAVQKGLQSELSALEKRTASNNNHSDNNNNVKTSSPNSPEANRKGPVDFKPRTTSPARDTSKGKVTMEKLLTAFEKMLTTMQNKHDKKPYGPAITSMHKIIAKTKSIMKEPKNKSNPQLKKEIRAILSDVKKQVSNIDKTYSDRSKKAHQMSQVPPNKANGLTTKQTAPNPGDMTRSSRPKTTPHLQPFGDTQLLNTATNSVAETDGNKKEPFADQKNARTHLFEGKRLINPIF